MTRQMLVPIALLLLAGRVSAQQPDSAAYAGDWQGTLTAAGKQTRYVIHVKAAAGVLSGTYHASDQKTASMPLSSISINKRGLQIAFDITGPWWDGKLTPDGSALTGTWTNAFANLQLNLFRPDIAAPPLPARAYNGVEGQWEGTFAFQGASMHALLEITKEASMLYGGTFAVAEAGTPYTSLQRIVFKESVLHFEIADLGIKWDGKLSAAQDELTGKWSDGKDEMPLNFVRRVPAPMMLIAGRWQGALTYNGTLMRSEIEFRKAPDGKYIDTYTLIKDVPESLAIGNISYARSLFRFTVGDTGIFWEGKPNAAGSELIGTLHAQGEALPLTFTRKVVTLPEKVQGVWRGMLKTGSVRYVLHFSRNAKDGTTGTFELPDKGSKTLPLTDLDLYGDTIHIEFNDALVTWEGKLNAAGDELVGALWTNGVTAELNFKRDAAGKTP